MYKFCCCIPVRAGVFILAIFTALVSALLSASMFISLRKDPHAGTSQKATLIVAGIVWGLLFIFSVFGFVGAVSARRSLVLVYSRILWVWWFLSTFVGSLLIWNLFRSSFHKDFLVACEAQDPKNNTADVCEHALTLGRGIYIGVFVAFQLIVLYSCIIVGRYVKQLQEDSESMAVRRMENTLNNMSYAYTSQQNSFGNANAPPVASTSTARN